MNSESVEAYDFSDRVSKYDADMDIMHPLRWKMIEVALEVIPYQKTQSLTALDLGVGTGVFAKRFLENYPNSKVFAIDGAASMLKLAKSRLGDLAQCVEWILAEFQTIPATVTRPDTFDVVISSYALHHLNAQEKLAVLKSVVRAIRPGGWFLNADIVTAAAPDVEERIQEIRVKAVTDRAPAPDKRFRSTDATRQFLDDLEATEQDQPQTLEQDIRILREAGIANAEVFWKEYREAVIGGRK
jgi:tRNA (cmo5U34)-methyltransferase